MVLSCYPLGQVRRVVSALSGQEGGGEAAFPADFTYMDVCVEDAEDQACSKPNTHKPQSTEHTAHSHTQFMNISHLN